MSWIVTQRYIDVAARPTRGRRAARLSMARLQLAGAGSGVETKRSALGAHLSVDTHVLVDWYSRSKSQSHCEILNTKTG